MTAPTPGAETRPCRQCSRPADRLRLDTGTAEEREVWRCSACGWVEPVRSPLPDLADRLMDLEREWEERGLDPDERWVAAPLSLLEAAADALQEREEALREAQAVVKVAASLLEEVEAVHKLTGGSFRDALRVELVRMAASEFSPPESPEARHADQ